MNLEKFRLIAAPFTPMHADGSLNLSVVSRQAEHLVANGVRGVFVAGTSGEGQSLTLEERMGLAEAWGTCPERSRLQIFVHVGHNCSEDAVRLARHAVSIKADAIAVHAPTWWKFQKVESLLELCATIAEAATNLPFYLYDIPDITGVHASSSQFLAAAKERIPNIAGVKYTNADLASIQECIQMHDGKYDILWGSDQSLLAGIALGASGAVGSTYNFAAPLYHRIIKAAATNDWHTARREQAKSVAMVRAIQKYDLLAALKYTMAIAGLDCGPVRFPVRNLTSDEQIALRAELQTTDAVASQPGAAPN
jgi:N-acetylneuraminate lyase